MEKLQSQVGTGSHVRARGESWCVVNAETFETCSLITLRGIGHENFGQTSRLLTPFDRLQPLTERLNVRRASRAAVLRHAARAIVSRHGWEECWTAALARIDLLPWQLEPARAAVSGATRLLLADAVGLGKTIQAGLVLSELRARGLISTALILTPAGLCEQWASELSDRFNLRPTVFDQASLLRLTATLPVGVNPWSTCEFIIASIDLVKRPEVRAALDGLPFDVLIVDEAHHLTPGTDRLAVVSELGARSPWIVLATATPHSGDDHAYDCLAAVGSSHATDRLQVFKRQREDVENGARRRAHFHAVTSTPRERELLDAVLAYTRLLWRSGFDASRESCRLLACVIARRATSSVAALQRTLQRRRDLLGGMTISTPTEPRLPWDEVDDEDAVESDRLLGTAGWAARDDELMWLDRLISLANRAELESSKLRVVRRILRRTPEAAIVFTEYRDTAEDLRERLEPTTGVDVLHGALPVQARREVIQRFLDGHTRVLIATDAAGEGLNLQMRCRLVINLELAWNPLRLEQRIGRVDRLGQTRRVHALHLFFRDTFEETVLARLQRRARQAGVNVGRQWPSERDVASAVLEDGSFDTESGSAAASAVRTDSCWLPRIAADRRMLPHATRAHPAGACLVSVPRRGLVNGLIVLYECELVDAAGRLTSHELLPVQITVQPATRFRRGNIRHLVEVLPRLDRVQATLHRELTKRVAAVARATAVTGTAVGFRIAQMRSHLLARPKTPVQASLFDRRAEQRAHVADAAVAKLRAHFERKAEAAAALARLRPASAPRVVAVWTFGDSRRRTGER